MYSFYFGVKEKLAFILADLGAFWAGLELYGNRIGSLCKIEWILASQENVSDTDYCVAQTHC